MERLSKEFLEKLVADKHLNARQIQVQLEQEIKLLTEEITRRVQK